MKKIMSLALLTMLPFFTHTMESSLEIGSSIKADVLNAIEKSMGSLRYIRMKSQSADGAKIAIIDQYGDVSLWDGKTGKQLDEEVARNLQGVTALGFNQDGTKVIVTTSTGLREYTAIATASADALNAIEKSMRPRYIMVKSQSADGTKIAIVDQNGDVSLWDGKTGKQLDEEVARNLQRVTALGFNQDGSKVIVTTSKGPQEYTAIATASADVLKAIEKSMRPRYIMVKSQSADGTKIAILDQYGDVSLWDVETGKQLGESVVRNLQGVTALGFNQDGTKVIVTTSKGPQEFPIKK